jgi:hypothetical protein
MAFERWRFVIVAALAALGGCTKSQGAKCTADSQCTNPAYPFCDVNGEFPASGGDKNVCTIVPSDCPVERCGCSPGATSCSADQLLTCDPSGKSQTMTACSLGCAGDGTRCLTFDPTNGLGPALGLAGMKSAVAIPSGATIDADAGTIKDTGGIAINADTLVVTQGASSIRVFLAGSFTIGDVSVTGHDALAFVASGDVSITGVIAAAANFDTNGAGAESAGTCLGEPGQSGGGGGGNATAGGDGGQPDILSNPRAHGGVAESTFEPLVGGCAGGALGSAASPTAPGGGGGGAIQVISASAISIAGGLDVSGGGGGTDGGGGGAGGTVVLEAPTVGFSGTAAGIYTNGGSGGACTAPGANGTRDAAAAPPPAPCGYMNRSHAGNGGTATVIAGSGATSAVTGNPTGGGGAVGRLRIATKDGTFAAGTALLSAAVAMDQLAAK